VAAAAAAYFGEHALPTAEDVAAYYRARNLAAVIFTVDAETVTGRPAVPNEEIAEVVAAKPTSRSRSPRSTRTRGSRRSRRRGA
jgi:hypothetical protein